MTYDGRCKGCGHLTTTPLNGDGLCPKCLDGKLDYGRVFEFKEHHRQALDEEYEKIGAGTTGEKLVWLKVKTGFSWSDSKTDEEFVSNLEWSYAESHFQWDDPTEETAQAPQPSGEEE